MIRLVLAASLAVSALAAPAAAQTRAPSERSVLERSVQDRNTVRRQQPGQAVCIPWCPADLNPCDPPQFKQADGRCGHEP